MREFQKELEALLNKYIHDLDGYQHNEIREAAADVIDFHCNPETTQIPTWR